MGRQSQSLDQDPRALPFVPVPALVAVLVFLAAKVVVFSSTLAWTPPFVVLSLLALLVVVGLIVPGGQAAKKA